MKRLLSVFFIFVSILFSADEVIVINGHTLPPEPEPKLNNATLLGIGVNHNGVRDDVERWIYKTYKHPIERGIFMQSARAYQKVIVDPSRAKDTKEYSDNVISCLFYWTSDNLPVSLDMLKYYDNSKKLKEIQFNTSKRYISYERYQAVLNGGVYDLLSSSKEKCEFDENGILIPGK